jgi:PAS domain S-box-containing protein
MARQDRRPGRGATATARRQPAAEAALFEALQGTLETAGFVIDALPDGVAVLDRRRRVVYANAALRSLLGVEPDRVSGRRCETLFPTSGRARLRSLFDAWMMGAGGTDVPGGRGGRDGPILGLTGVPLRTPSFSGALVVVRDVSEARLRRRQEGILAAVGYGLVQSATLSETCLHLLRTLGAALSRPAGSVLLLDGRLDEGGVVYHWRAGTARRPATFGSERLRALSGMAARVIATGEPCSGPAADEEGPAAVRLARGIDFVHAFPILSEGRVLGVIELFGRRGPDPLLDAVLLPLTTTLGAHVTVRQAVEQLRQVFEASPVGICLLSRSGRVDRANPAFAAMLERDPLGLELLELVDDADRPGVGRLWAEVHRGRRDRFEIEVRGRRPGVRPAWLRLVVAAEVPAGRGEGMVLAAEDVTERHLAAESLRAALAAKSAVVERMERISEVGTRAMSVVSHEFRTGLFGMQGYSEMLSRRELPPATVREYAASINSDAKRMGRLINDLLDLNRMEAGREQLQCVEIDLGSQVVEAVERARSGTDHHTFTVEVAPDLPRVVADPDRLAQVLGNLLGNAVKYSPRGGDVRVRAGRHPDGVLIEVADRGIGIPAGMLEAVFEPFTRSTDRGAEAIKGTGLGLPIVRHIVRLHGGRVWAESPRRGATFRVVLPPGPRPDVPSRPNVPSPPDVPSPPEGEGQGGGDNS